MSSRIAIAASVVAWAGSALAAPRMTMEPGMDDRITVESLPEGVFARPMEAEVADGDSLAVCLFEWSGL
jgi:hypothetical protein